MYSSGPVHLISDQGLEGGVACGFQRHLDQHRGNDSWATGNMCLTWHERLHGPHLLRAAGKETWALVRRAESHSPPLTMLN